MTYIEATLFMYLKGRVGQVITRAELMAEVWEQSPALKTRRVDQAISTLRKEIAPHYQIVCHSKKGYELRQAI